MFESEILKKKEIVGVREFETEKRDDTKSKADKRRDQQRNNKIEFECMLLREREKREQKGRE